MPLIEAWIYARQNWEQFLAACQTHLLLVAIPLGIASAIALPLGWVSSRSPTASFVLINGFNSLRTIPSLAILFVAIPYLGLTFQAAALAITLLAIPPILINTDVAFRTLATETLEAATAMGMTQWQRWHRVELPLALPTIVAGMRTATVEAIASATLAAFIGAGGLGDFIVLGFALYRIPVLLVGAIPVAFLALVAEIVLSSLQRVLTGIRKRDK